MVSGQKYVHSHTLFLPTFYIDLMKNKFKIVKEYSLVPTLQNNEEYIGKTILHCKRDLGMELKTT